ncbi:hypothetical protein FNI86_12090, partial [Salmonella enterica subsp. salamae]|nr:hypothetical protein [Salmonella enterica subsp. salamae]
MRIFSSRSMRITSWGMILIQVLTPLLMTVSSITRAAEINNMEETIFGLQSIVDGDGYKVEQPTSSLPPQENSHPFNLINNPPTPPIIESSNPSKEKEKSVSSLPSLGISNAPANAEDDPIGDVSGKVMQAGQILSSDNATDASFNYARSIGEGLINQQINDWLNQKGSARVSASSDQKIAGDLLVPIINNDDSLLFTQIGLHSNDDRNTANFGLGYRQYVGDWMYGINTFYDYDYDYTGKNARIGVGGEAWTDYLKLAANGYFRITNWHQSHLDSMEDYDERPANGFDIRADAYLPSYPQFGANIKYEQYFGKGIDLGTGTNPDDLKDNPAALTVGVNYTPIPLFTLKGEQSTGDSNESRFGLDINYRFGVPWSQQVDPDAVDIQRSLMGSKYEFVNRNYDIVMQYRKQDLIHISLPPEITAKAAETITLPLTVNKAKYGLKDVEWTPSAELLANGGTVRELSLTQLEVTLPAYIYNQNTVSSQDYVVKAVGIDNNGNYSNVAATTIKVNPSKNIVSDLSIAPSGSLPANDSDYFTVIATIRAEDGQAMVSEPIKFDISGLDGTDGHPAGTVFKGGTTNSSTLKVNTDSQGQATVFVRSKIAKEGTITATMNNGNYKSGYVNFIADAATAQITGLEVTKNNALADGQSTDKLLVTVKDGNGNALSDVQVDLSATNGAMFVDGTSVTTDAQGQAILSVTNTAIGDSTITARINGSSKEQVVTFVADKSSAKIMQNDISATQDAIANGTATNHVTARVTDNNGNMVAGVTVSFSVSSGANITTTKGVSGDDGIATAEVTSRKAATYTVTATIRESGNRAQTDTRFIADSSTATITDSNLIIDPNGAVANGSDIDGVTAVVTDANGNTVPNAIVSFDVAVGASIATVIGTTGDDGIAKAEVTSHTADKYNVTATVNGHSAIKEAIFIADGGSATIVSGNLIITKDNAKANGTDTNAVQAKVTDSNGNLVPNVMVSFTAGNGASVTRTSVATDLHGLASTTLTNVTMGVTKVTATVNGNNQSVDTTFVADDSSATIINGDLTVTVDNAKANGTDSNAVQAKVTDANGNAVSDITVNFTANNGGSITTAAAITGANGLASTTLTNVTAGVTKVTATVNGHSQSVDTTFVADSGSATIINGDLVVTKDNAKADGTATNAVQAKV